MLPRPLLFPNRDGRLYLRVAGAASPHQGALLLHYLTPVPGGGGGGGTRVALETAGNGWKRLAGAKLGLRSSNRQIIPPLSFLPRRGCGSLRAAVARFGLLPGSRRTRLIWQRN